MKKLKYLLMFALVCILSLGVKQDVFAYVDSGQCGENVYYEFDYDTMVLRIYGTGDMYDYSSSSKPPYPNWATSIVIEEGVTSIGDYAFEGFTGFSSLDIPSSITSLGEYAFSNCDALEKVVIPDTVEYVGDYLLYGCDTQIEVYFENNLESLSTTVLPNFIKKVKLPNGLKSIPKDMFKEQRDLISVEIPESVTRIEESAFQGCTNLSSLILPKDITYIGASAFANSMLVSIEIPSKVTTIEENTFKYCVELQTIVIPNSVTNIEDYAFYGCTNAEIVVPETVTSVGENSFYECPHVSFLNDDLEAAAGYPYGASQFHTYSDEFTIDIEPTCTEVGEKSRYCIFDSCKYKMETTPIPKLGHDISEWVYADNYNIENGYRYKPCSRDYCNERFEEQYLLNTKISENISNYSIEHSYYTAGDNVEITAVPEDGYSVTGWSYSDGSVASTTPTLSFTMPEKAVEVKANTEPNTYSINITSGDNGFVSFNVNDLGNGFKYNTNFKIDATCVGGYSFFKAVDSNGNEYTSLDKVYTVTGDESFTIYSKPNTDTPYTVNHYVMNPDGTYPDEPTKKETKIGTTDTVADLTGYYLASLEVTDGIKFDRCEVNGKEVTTANINGDGSTTFNLYYDRKSYTITFNKGKGVKELEDTMSYFYGQNVTLPNVEMLDGYEFSGWSGDKSSSNMNYKFQMPANNISLTANGVGKKYEITYTLNGGGFNSTYVTSYSVEDVSFTLINPTKLGYKFTGWTGDNGNTPQSQVVIEKGTTGNKSYTANWDVMIYNISYDLAGGQVANDLVETYTVETPDFAIINPEKAGYEFVGWSGTIGDKEIEKDGLVTEMVVKAGTTGNISLTANYEELEDGTTFEVDGMIYKIVTGSNGERTVVLVGTTKEKSDSTFTSLNVPDTVTLGELTFKVTGIGEDAFAGYTYLKEVTIGKNVEEVGDNAFGGCTQLERIVTTNEKLVIKETVITGCPNITNYPGKQEDIKDDNTEDENGDEEKEDDEKGEDIDEDEDNTVSGNNGTDNKKEDTDAKEEKPGTTGGNDTSGQGGKTPSSQAPSGQTQGSKEPEVKVGTTFVVKSMKYKVTKFDGKSGEVSLVGTTKKKTDKKFTKLTVAKSVKYNGYTFKVTKVGNKAFKGYKKLKSVVIGSNVVTIGKESFSGCTSLKNVTVGKNVKTISSKAFYKCKKLKTITIKSKKLKSVGSKSITGINKKATIKVPSSKVKSYKKLFKAKTGYKSTMTIKK